MGKVKEVKTIVNEEVKIRANSYFMNNELSQKYNIVGFNKNGLAICKKKDIYGRYLLLVDFDGKELIGKHYRKGKSYDRVLKEFEQSN